MNDTTEKLTALRLSFHHSATVAPRTFWHRLSKPTAASHLLKSSHQEGIELVDRKSTLRGFLTNHCAHLENVRALFMPCEAAMKSA